MSFADEQTSQSSETVPPILRQRRRRRRSNNKILRFFRKLRKRIRWRVVGISLFTFLVVVGLVLVILITDAANQLNGAQQSLNRVLNSLGNQTGVELTLADYDRLRSSVNELDRRLDIAQSRIDLVQQAIGLNPDWQAADMALDISQELVRASNAMLSGLEPALFFIVEGEDTEAFTTNISSGERLVELLDLGQGRFAQADIYLASAFDMLGELDLRTVSAETLLQADELQSYYEQLRSLNSVLISAPSLLEAMLGLDDERAYIVLGQNNDEIRPSGGYTSTYGWFTIRSGRIVDFDYSPTTTTSPRPPDESFLETIDIPDWWLRFREPIYAAWDGSWYVDFPSTADMAMDYYNAGDNPHSPVDGVIAIDITGFELILDALGSVVVEEYDVIVTADNFREIVYDIRAFGEGVAPHKEFVATVYNEIFDEWRSVDQDRTPAILGKLLEAVQSRHVMIYFAEPELHDVVAQLDWDGGQNAATSHDYIMIADANLGNKSNNSVQRNMTYDVEILPDGQLEGRLSVRYDYFASVADEDPAVDPEFHGPLNYNFLMQVFLPAGAELTTENNFRGITTVPTDEHTLLVTRETLLFDGTERYQLEYQLPSLTESLGEYQRYRLLIQKQPGARSQSMNLQITLPETARVIQSSPPASAIFDLEQPVLDYRLEIDSDVWISVIYAD